MSDGRDRMTSAGLTGLLAGAAGSVALMLYAGRHNPSLLLMLLFALWVLSPFMTMIGGNAVSKRWPPRTRAALYGVMLIVTLGSLAIYGVVALGPPKAKMAFFFVVVPPASLLLIATVVAIVAFVSRRQWRPG